MRGERGERGVKTYEHHDILRVIYHTHTHTGYLRRVHCPPVPLHHMAVPGCPVGVCMCESESIVVIRTNESKIWDVYE